MSWFDDNAYLSQKYLNDLRKFDQDFARQYLNNWIEEHPPRLYIVSHTVQSFIDQWQKMLEPNGWLLDFFYDEDSGWLRMVATRTGCTYSREEQVNVRRFHSASGGTMDWINDKLERILPEGSAAHRRANQPKGFWDERIRVGLSFSDKNKIWV